MSYRAARLVVASGLALWGWTGVEAQTVVTPLYPGITHISRTEQYASFQCPDCPAPTSTRTTTPASFIVIPTPSMGSRSSRTWSCGTRSRDPVRSCGSS